MKLIVYQRRGNREVYIHKINLRAYINYLLSHFMLRISSQLPNHVFTVTLHRPHLAYNNSLTARYDNYPYDFL